MLTLFKYKKMFFSFLFAANILNAVPDLFADSSEYQAKYIKCKIDGNLDEWKNIKAFSLNKMDNYVPFGTTPYEGIEDLGCVFWWGYDEDNLYLAAEVTDNAHYQKKTDATAGQLWQDDCIQICFSSASSPERFEYGFGLSQFGIINWCWSSMGGGQCNRPIKEMKIQIKRDESFRKTLYEVAIPWKLLKPLDYMQSPIKGSFAVIDNDGRGIKQWREWTPLRHKSDTSTYASLSFAPSPCEREVKNDSVSFLVSPKILIEKQPFEVRLNYVSAKERKDVKIKIFVYDKNTKIIKERIAQVNLKKGINVFKYSICLPDSVKMDEYTVKTIIDQNNAPLDVQSTEISYLTKTGIKKKLQDICIPELEKLLAKAEKTAACKCYYQRAKLTLIKDFGKYVIPYHLRRKYSDSKSPANSIPAIKSRNWWRANFNADYILKKEKELKEDLNAIIQGKIKPPKIYDIKGDSAIRVQNGAFYSGNHPVFLCGVCGGNWENLRDIRKQSDYGFNNFFENRWKYQQIGGFANFKNYSYIPEWIKNMPIKEIETPYSKGWKGSFVAVEEEVKRCNMKMNTLLQFGRDWKNEYPEISLKKLSPSVKNRWMNVCLDNQTFWNWQQKYFKELVPLIDNNTVFAVAIAAEPEYICFCPESQKMFQKWLFEKYGNIEKLNQRWQKQYKSFSEIIIKYNSWKKDYPAFFDYLSFNNDRFFKILKQVKSLMRKNGYTGMIHCFITKDAFERNFEDLGLDLELISREITDITGIDNVFYLPSKETGQSSYQEFAIYDLMKSFAPEKPIFDPEWHLFYPDKGYYPYFSYGQISQFLWRSALHGVGALNAYYWSRTELKDIDSLPFNFAESTDGYSKTCLDLRRVYEDVCKFSNSPAEVAIFYTPDSIYFSDYWDKLYYIYNSLYLDTQIRFITDRQIKNGELKKFKCLFIPGASRVKDETCNSIKNYVLNGGNIFFLKGSFEYDEYNYPRANDDFMKLLSVDGTKTYGKGRLLVSVPLKLKEMKKLLSAFKRDSGVKSNVFLKTEGNVEYRMIKDKGDYLLYIVNIEDKPLTAQIAFGFSIDSISDILAMKQINFQGLQEKGLTLKPYEILLWRIKANL
jgi:hypothetical protein